MPAERDLKSSTVVLVRSVFQAVWTQFSIWEQEYCRESNARAMRPALRRSRTTSGNSGRSNSCSIPTVDMTDLVTDLNISASLTRISLPLLEPYPVYESSTPILGSIWKGDDPDCMPFIPHADDPTFDAPNHATAYRTLAWTKPQHDPDLEIILLEVVKVLHYRHGLSIADIDGAGVLPMNISPLPRKPGLLQLVQQRDLLDWPGASAFPIPSLPHSEHTSLKARLDTIVSLFCPNLNCIHSCCTLHEHQPPHIRPVVPRLRNADLRHEETEPCADKCFLNHELASFEDTPWTAEEIATLQAILSIMPDSLPCDLAVLCRKPCREVHRERAKLIPDHTIKSSSAKGRVGKRLTFEYDPDVFTPNDPCVHPGSCDADANCPCFSNRAHCERSCRCDDGCPRRWRGCRCTRTCLAHRCPCYHAHRECEADLCLKCDARTPGSACQNVALQQGHLKKTEVGSGRWGLGLSICEVAEEGDLIGEYVGELILEETFLSRCDISTHRMRNYAFGLNSTLTIDGSFAGNCTRYINHVERNDPRINAKAIVRQVNGDHRIGIFASKRIEPGSEIFFDYGSGFFKPKEEHVKRSAREGSRRRARNRVKQSSGRP